MSNRIWYDTLPAALYLEPESYQDDISVRDRVLGHSKVDEIGATLPLSSVRPLQERSVG